MTLARGSAPAISQDCVGCGACINACPSGAIQTADPTGARGGGFDRIRATDREWVAHLQTAAPGGVLRLTCARADAQAEATFACLGRLTEPLLLGLYLREGLEIRVIKPDCSRCPWRAAGAAFDRVALQTRSLLRWLGISQERLQVVSAPRIEKPAQPPQTAVSRRALITDAARQAAGAILDTVIPGVPADQFPPGSGGVFREKIVERKGDPKRTYLLEILTALRGRKNQGATALPTAEDPPAAGWVASIEIAPECMGCNVCEALCPTGAIRRAQTERLFSLFFTPSRCTACDVCAQACYPRALRLRRTGDPAALLGEEIRVFESQKKVCQACGATLVFEGLGSDSYCPLCLLQERRRLAVAHQRLIGPEVR